MKMKRRLLTLAAFLLVILLAACGNNDSNAESADGGNDNNNEVITVGYQKGNTINILKERGNLDEALEEAGYSIDWREFPTGSVLLEALNTNNIDFGHASDGNGVFMQSGGHDINYVASEAPYPEGVALVAKAESDIESVEDLEGKTIGVTKGGNQHYLLLEALEEAGVSLDDVEIRYYKDASEGLIAFTQDEFDVYGSWDPYLAIVESQIDTRTIVNGTDFSENRTFYFATDELVNDNPEVVSIILEELQNVDQWSNENKEEVAEILAEQLGLDGEPLELANNRRTFGVESMKEEIIDSQQRLADVFYESGLLENDIQVEDAVNVEDIDLPENVD